MASTKADNNRVAWKYTDDGGGEWTVSAKAVYVLDVTDGSKYGGSAPAASVKAKPREMRMRAVKCITPTGVAVWIPAYDVTAAIWDTPGTTVTRDQNGIDVVCTATASHRGEHYRDGIRDTI